VQLTAVAGDYAVARAGPADPVPPGALEGAGFWSVSRNSDELSVVGPTDRITDMDRIDAGWTCFKVHGPFAFDEVGIVAGLSRALSEAGIGIFVVSTFDTDYILVKDPKAAAMAWRAQGHEVEMA
jgi:hypothetical protein